MPTTKSRKTAPAQRSRKTAQNKPEPQAQPAAPPKPEPELPQLPQMTKTEAYALIKKAREGLRDADNSIWRGTYEQVQEALLESITHTTHVLDALKHGGIKGVS